MASMTKNNLLIFNPVTLADVRKMHFPPYNSRPSEILIVAATVGVVVLLIHSTLLPDASCIVLPQHGMLSHQLCCLMISLLLSSRSRQAFPVMSRHPEEDGKPIGSSHKKAFF